VGGGAGKGPSAFFNQTGTPKPMANAGVFPHITSYIFADRSNMKFEKIGGIRQNSAVIKKKSMET
jgi:hypothetical protein